MDNNKIISMKYDDFERLIDFYSESRSDRIYFTDYEVYEHEDIYRIVKKIEECNNLSYIQFDSVLIMNDDFISILSRLRDVKNMVSICSYLDFYSDIEFESYMLPVHNLEMLKKNDIDIDVGINLNNDYINFKSLRNILKKYEIKTIRWEFSVPDKPESSQNFYNKIKDNLLPLLDFTVNEKIKTYPKSCNIPLCFLTDEEIRFIAYSSDYNLNGITCDKNIEVFPDLSFKPCSGYNGEKLYIKDYNSYKEVENKCDEIMNNYNSKMLFEKCNNCEKFTMKKKSCGCMRFK